MADLSNPDCGASVSGQWEVRIYGIQHNEPLTFGCFFCEKSMELSSSCQQTLSDHTNHLLSQYDKLQWDISIKFIAAYKDHTITSLSFEENKVSSLATLPMKHDFWGWQPESCPHKVFATPPLPLRLFRPKPPGSWAMNEIQMRCITCLNFERIERLLQHRGYFTPFKHLHLRFRRDSSRDTVVSSDEELKRALQEYVQDKIPEWKKRCWNKRWIKHKTGIKTWRENSLPRVSIEPISSPMGPFVIPRGL
jgi:hypothetical protein